MNLETIACNQCGAPLSIPDAAQFVRCNHCGASLAVRRNESVTYTEIAAIAEHTAELAEHVAHLRYESELARIDREWETERRKYMFRDRDGKTHVPNSAAATLVGVMTIVAGIIWIIAVSAIGGPLFAIFGVLFSTLGYFVMLNGRANARRFEHAHAAYQRRRMHLSPDDFRPSRGDSPEL